MANPVDQVPPNATPGPLATGGVVPAGFDGAEILPPHGSPEWCRARFTDGRLPFGGFPGIDGEIL